MSNSTESSSRPHVVVLGAGFAAFRFLRKIDTKAYRVTAVSPRNHFLFTPLLTGTTVGSVGFRSIIEPLRGARKDLAFSLGTCTSIDAEAKTVHCQNPLDDTTFSLEYDRLVIAVGGENNTFGIPGVEEHTHFLKELSDARAIRQNVTGCLERAAVPGVSKEERQRLLHWVIVGGGPTGIEFAAELHDFLKDAGRWYPEEIKEVTITVLEAMDEILPSFDQELQDYALRRFHREGITVHTESPAEKVERNRITLASGETVDCGLVVWSTGIAPRPLIRDCDLPKSDKGMLQTDAHCQVVDHPELFALGDTAQHRDRALPATAQVAEQEGKYLADRFNREAKSKKLKPLHFKSKGMLAYVGGHRALADLPHAQVTGRKAWLFWRSVYLTKLVSVKNKILVAVDWCLTGLFGRDISRF